MTIHMNAVFSAIDFDCFKDNVQVDQELSDNYL